MNKLNIVSLIITVIFGSFLAFVAVSPAHAALFDGSKQQACKGANLENGTCEYGKARQGIEKTLENIVNFLTVIVGIVAVILIIINGLKFITSNGDSNAITSARSGIIYALVGLIIVALAQVIVRFVISKASS